MFWDFDVSASLFLNKSANTNENNASAITIIKKSPRCLILFKTAICHLNLWKYSARKYHFMFNNES